MKVYRFLAYTIAVLVVVQAGAIAWAFFGMVNEIDQNGLVINKACLESDSGCGDGFVAEWGFAIHMFFNGFILIPLVSLILLITSFFAKVPKGIAMAAGLVGLVALQMLVLPELSRQFGAGFGAAHGVNALILMGVAIMAGHRASVSMRTAAAPGTDTSHPVPA